MNILIYCIANFMCAAIETDVVHHRTARWEKDSQRKPGSAASKQGRDSQWACAMILLVGWTPIRECQVVLKCSTYFIILTFNKNYNRLLYEKSSWRLWCDQYLCWNKVFNRNSHNLCLMPKEWYPITKKDIKSFVKHIYFRPWFTCFNKEWCQYNLMFP